MQLDRSNFYNRVYDDARARGLPDAQARLAASQASLETNFGQSVVGNNYFGIKAGPSWNGPSVQAGTWEEVNGSPVSTTAGFRAYQDPANSIQDWSSTINNKWPGAATAPDFGTAVEGLKYGQPGGYATDSQYGRKLRSIDANYFTPPADIPNPPSARPEPDLRAMMSEPQGLLPAPVSPVESQPLSPPSAAQSMNPQAMNDLRKGLLEQQRQYGVLPSLDNPAYAAIQAQAPIQQPIQQPQQMQTVQPAQPAQQTAYTQPQAQQFSPYGGLLSPQEGQAFEAQKQYLGSQAMNKAPSNFGKGLRNFGGTLTGALLGAALLGPVGGLLGGYMGRKVVQPGGLLGSDFPDRPQGQSRGDGSLTEYGRNVSQESGQFNNAVNSGSSGLW